MRHCGDPAAADALLRSAVLLDANQCQIQCRSVFEFLKVNARKFDVVFCDPPFGDQVHATFLAGLIPHLADQALVYVESAEALELLVADGRRYQVEKFSKAGAVYFGLLRFIPAS